MGRDSCEVSGPTSATLSGAPQSGYAAPRTSMRSLASRLLTPGSLQMHFLWTVAHIQLYVYLICI